MFDGRQWLEGTTNFAIRKYWQSGQHNDFYRTPMDNKLIDKFALDRD